MSGSPAIFEGLSILLFNGLPLRDASGTSRFRRLKDHRGGHEKRNHEDHDPNKENEQLHRDLHSRVEQQTQAALRDRFAGQISLHLALIAAEICQSQKSSANKPAPSVVSIAPVQSKFNDI